MHGERRCISELPPGEGAACGSVRRPGINLETRGVRTGGGERAERLRAAGSRGRAVGAGGRMNRWPTGSLWGLCLTFPAKVGALGANSLSRLCCFPKLVPGPRKGEVKPHLKMRGPAWGGAGSRMLGVWSQLQGREEGEGHRGRGVTHRGAPWGIWSLTRRFLARISTLGPWEERTVRPGWPLPGVQGACGSIGGWAGLGRG